MKTIVSATLLLFTINANAGIHQCPTADGGMEFTDVPCGDAGKQVAIPRHMREDPSTIPTAPAYPLISDAYPSINDQLRYFENREFREQDRKKAQITTDLLRTQKPMSSYQAQLRQREIDMEIGQLRDDLGRVNSRGLGSYGRARAIEGQIRELQWERQELNRSFYR